MRVGVLGGGQLARLLALAGQRLGISITCLDPATDACAAGVARHIRAAFDDTAALDALAAASDVVSCEIEHVPPSALEWLGRRVPLRPSPAALRAASDRLAEKHLFRELGMATPAFAPVSGADDLEPAALAVGLPALLKTRHAGYDGKGQRLVRDRGELAAAWRALGGAPAILEAQVNFSREVSVIAARGADGETVIYPLSENIHRQGILRLALSRPADPFQARAEALVARLLQALDYVGVLALELFQSGDELLANEFAPRVHNSGHWTLRGAATSQFENHLRAVLGLPLGPATPVGTAAMVNFIGRMPDTAAVLAVPHAHLHVYGKAPRPQRKLGHATVSTADAARCNELAARLAALAAAADGSG